MAIISIPTSISGVSIPGQMGQVLSGPLAALFGAPGLKMISYPQELATDATKSHYVQFSVKEIIPQSFENIKQELSPVTNGAGELYTKGKNALTSTYDQVTSDTSGTYNKIVNNFSLTGLIESGTEAATSTVKAVGEFAGKADTVIRSLVKPKTTESKAVISLYMPDTLETSYTANYNEISLSDELNMIQSIRQIGQIATNAGEGVKSGGTVFGAASSDPNVINTAVGAALGGLDKLGIKTGGALTEVLLQGQGYASNPQLQMLYRGTGFRNFQLAFTFTPKSQAEAQIVNNIIYQFKYYAAPALAQGKTSSSEAMFLIPPAIFNIDFLFQGIDNKYLPKYADCVLKNIDVNYAPNGFAAHIDGAPVQTHMTLQFEEIEIVDKARLSKGYHNQKDGLR